MLRVEVAERRLHEIVVPQVAVILDELLAAVVRASAIDGLMKRRHCIQPTGRQRMEYVSINQGGREREHATRCYIYVVQKPYPLNLK